MAAYSLSEKAVSDLDGIYEYAILNFGLEQARAYLLGLHECFQILADNPGIGRSATTLQGSSDVTSINPTSFSTSRKSRAP
jgi:toxin ParE1/3/4